VYTGINTFKEAYQPRTTLVNNENNYLLADFHNILNRWKNYFSQLLNVLSVNNVRQIEIHAAEPLLSDSIPSEFEITTTKLKSINRQMLIKFRQN
jgi:hypothetical protein